MLRDSLILLIRHHRMLGYIFSPFIGRVSSDATEASVQSPVTVSDLETTALFDYEKEIVKTCNKYSDSYLIRHFLNKSRKKKAGKFYDKISQEHFDKVVKPFIDKRLFEVFELAADNKVPVFIKEGQDATKRMTSPVKLNPVFLKPHFLFKKTPDGIRYRLKILNNGTALELDRNKVSFLTDYPLLLFSGNEVYFLKELNSKILKPFFKKEEVLIPEKFEKKYLEGFVRKAVRDFDVELEGMSLIHKKQDAPKLRLALTKDLYGDPSLCLSFIYSKTEVYRNDKQGSIVELSEHEGNVTYVKIERSAEDEKKAVDILKKSGLRRYLDNYFTIEGQQTTGEELVKWLNKNHDFLLERGFKLSQDDWTDSYYLGDVDLTVQVDDSRKDWFDLKMLIHLGDESFPFIRLVSNIRKGDPEFLLEDGRKFIIPDEWFSRYGDVMNFAKEEDGHLLLAKHHVGLLPAEDDNAGGVGSDELLRLYRQSFTKLVAEPEGLRGNLRNYQRLGLTWLYELQQYGFGGCLADDMGLGKTIQTIALLLKNLSGASKKDLQREGSSQMSLFDDPVECTFPSLLVMPTSLLYNWKNELKSFAPKLRVLLYTGQRAGLPKEFHRYDVILTSYGVMRIDVDILKKHHFHYLILDESQFVKNPHSKTYNALLGLHSDYRLALTGTPVENSLSDLWAQLHFLNRDLLGSYQSFQNRFVIPIERDGNEKREERLKQLIHPFIMRRRKEDVVKELPDLTEQVYWCEMTEEQHEAYERYKSGIRNSLLDIFEEGISKNEMRILEALLRMRQMSNHPKLAEPAFRGESGKFNEVLRSVENLVSEGHKALLFSSFSGYLDLFASCFDEQNYPYSMITGKTKNREEEVRKFQENEDTRLFLISLKAGGTGLNLTAADYVFILDPWWNPAAENQALSRAHRIGQKNKVFVYRFITRKTIEEKIFGLQKRKQELADTFVNFNNPLKQLSEEELRQLFDFKS